MTIREVANETEWERFVARLSPNTFLQSWAWGQVQQATGEEVRYLGFYRREQLAGVALVIIVNARRGRHYLIPHGPLLSTGQAAREVVPKLVQHLRQTAKRDNVCALRIAPLLETTQVTKTTFAQQGFRPAPMHVHAELTWILDISASSEELLAGMRKTTRHAIKKAEEKKITTEILTDPGSLNRFLPLYETTRSRHNFTPFSRKFLRTQMEEFTKRGQAFMSVARYQEQDVAAALCMHYGKTVFYHHGASRQLPGRLPATQLVQWTAIQEAQRRGATRYNFWGIAPDDQPSHPFAGITVFKKGFNGYAKDYLHAQDLPLSYRYWQLWLVETWRKHRRGF